MPYLNYNSQTTIEKVALNSFKKMIFGLSLNFSIEVTSMVYMDVEVTPYNGIYGDGVKVGVTTSVPH